MFNYSKLATASALTAGFVFFGFGALFVVPSAIVTGVLIKDKFVPSFLKG